MIAALASRAPVTLGLALAAAAVTMLGASDVIGDPWQWPALVTLLMHGDARHLVCDVGALLAIGLWVEPRAGSRRVLAWVGLSAAVSVLAHAIVYPGQSRLFGLSGTTYTLVFAAVCGWALNRAWGVALMAGLGAVLLDECVQGRSAALRVTSAAGEVVGAGGGWGGSFVDAPLQSTPWVHVACVGLGVVVGLAGRMRPKEPADRGARSRVSRVARNVVRT